VTAVLPPLPLPLRVANRVAAAWPRAMPSIDPGELVARARRRTGLVDLGDPPWEEPLARVCAALDAGDLSLTGRIAVRGVIAELLVTRLELAARLARGRGAPVERPLFIVGLPRTGTTLLHRLLACDPSTRWLTEAEAMYLPGGAHHRRRVLAYGLSQRLNAWLVPGLAAAHDRLDPTAPEEELPLLARSFACPIFNLACELPAYDAWLAARSHAAWVDVYAYHRHQLELAHAAGARGPFVLKSPVHTMGLPALLDVYPDALVVQTERDPAQIAASFLSMELMARALFVDPSTYDPTTAARCMLAFLALYQSRLAAGRRAAPDRVIGLRYDDLVADPMTAVRRIYAAWNRPLAAGAEARMQAFLAADERRERAPHHYRLADWGLGEHDVRAAGEAR
jgi:hypothetical protein